MNLLLLANLIICYCKKRNYNINSSKLHKLLYLYQAWHLVYMDKDLYDVCPIASPNGPWYKEIDDYFGEDSNDIIENDIAYNEELEKTYRTMIISVKLNVEQKQLLHSVLSKYAYLDLFALHLNMSYDEAWVNAREECNIFEDGHYMNLDDVKKYYNLILYEKKEESHF
jgi:uncharacterized phage-associated protein